MLFALSRGSQYLFIFVHSKTKKLPQICMFLSAAHYIQVILQARVYIVDTTQACCAAEQSARASHRSRRPDRLDGQTGNILCLSYWTLLVI